MAELNLNGNEREDQIDGRDPAVRRVLTALAADARRDPVRLAALTGLATDRVADLISRLERQRVIRGYKTVVDWERLGDDHVVAFIDVSVSPQREVGFDQVVARIYRHPRGALGPPRLRRARPAHHRRGADDA